MPRRYMCQYGNCDSYDTVITVTLPGNPGERMRFCCPEHAGLYLVYRSMRYRNCKVTLKDLDHLVQEFNR